MKQFIHKKPTNLITADSFDDNEGSYFDSFNKEQSDYKEYYDKVEGPAKDYYNKLSSINDRISGLDEFQKNPNSMNYEEATEKLEK